MYFIALQFSGNFSAPERLVDLLRRSGNLDKTTFFFAMVKIM